jgi:hypothetical protein
MMMSRFIQLFVLWIALTIQTASAQNVIVIGDLEGMQEGIQSYIDSGELKLVNGNLEFTKPGQKLLFLGDLIDRGPHSISMRKQMMNLQDRYPENVEMLIGNRDINKLDILRDLPEIQSLGDSGYIDYLKGQYKQINGKEFPADISHTSGELSKLNTVDRQVDYWLKSHSAPQALEFHRQEMESLLGKEVSASEAARDYIRMNSPGGEHFEYLKRAKIQSAGSNYASLHGGLTESNWGRVPGETEIFEDYRAWTDKLNDWKNRQLGKYEELFSKGIRGKELPGNLVEYGDAIWDPDVIDFETNRKGMLTFNDQSTIYPFRSKDGDNFLPLSEEISKKLEQQGIKYVYNGHSPSPNGPTVTFDGRVYNIMADTSFSSKGQGVQILHSLKESGTDIKWTMGDGTNVDYSIKGNKIDPYLGKMNADGYTINGYTKDGKAVLSRYATNSDGRRFQVDQKAVAPAELKSADWKYPKGGALDTDAKNYLANTQRALREQKGVRFSTFKDLERTSKGKVVFQLVSSSKFGQLPDSRENIQKIAKATVSDLVNTYGKENILVQWGGTDVSVGEVEFIKEFDRAGVRHVGLVNEGVVFKDVGIAKELVVVGKNGDWLGPGKKAAELTAKRNGHLISIGGGGIANDIIDHAEKSGLKNMHFMRGDPDYLKQAGEGATGGASVDYAKKYPNQAFGNSEELLQRFRASDSNRVFTSDELLRAAELNKPRKKSFIKDTPVLGYRIETDDFNDFPEEIRKHIGAEDQTKYTPEYLRKNKGSVIALQMNKDKPDFYLIGKDTYLGNEQQAAKYKNVPLDEVTWRNSAYFEKLKGQIPGTIESSDSKLVGILKTTPTEMVKMSDLGFPIGVESKIESPWGDTQTKPAGKDAYLVFDEGKQKYYMVNTGEDGLPLSYIPEKTSKRKLASATGPKARIGTLEPSCANGTIEAIANGIK